MAKAKFISILWWSKEQSFEKFRSNKQYIFNSIGHYQSWRKCYCSNNRSLSQMVQRSKWTKTGLNWYKSVGLTLLDHFETGNPMKEIGIQMSLLAKKVGFSRPKTLATKFHKNLFWLLPSYLIFKLVSIIYNIIVWHLEEGSVVTILQVVLNCKLSWWATCVYTWNFGKSHLKRVSNCSISSWPVSTLFSTTSTVFYAPRGEMQIAQLILFSSVLVELGSYSSMSPALTSCD